jgi:hypothetical protein
MKMELSKEEQKKAYHIQYAFENRERLSQYRAEYRLREGFKAKMEQYQADYRLKNAEKARYHCVPCGHSFQTKCDFSRHVSSKKHKKKEEDSILRP